MGVRTAAEGEAGRLFFNQQFVPRGSPNGITDEKLYTQFLVAVPQKTRHERTDMNFSEDIRRIRRKAFMSQEDFAKAIGVSFATVNRWETGKAKPNLKTMKLIDEYCKRNLIDFDISEEMNG